MAKKNLAIGHESFKKRFSASLFIGAISITGLSACSQGLSFAGFGKKDGGNSNKNPNATDQRNGVSVDTALDAAAQIRNMTVKTDFMNEVLGAVKKSPALFEHMQAAPITEIFKPDRFRNLESIEIDGVEIPNIADWIPYFEEMDRERAAEYPTFQSYLDSSDIKSVEDVRAQVDPEVITEVVAILQDGPEALINAMPAEESGSDSSSFASDDMGPDVFYLGSPLECLRSIFHVVGDVVGGAAGCVGFAGGAVGETAEMVESANTYFQTAGDAAGAVAEKSAEEGKQTAAGAGIEIAKKGVDKVGGPGEAFGSAAAGTVAAVTTPDSGCTYAGHHVGKGGCVAIAVAESVPCAGGFIKAGDDGHKMVGPEGCGRHRHHRGLRLRGYRR